MSNHKITLASTKEPVLSILTQFYPPDYAATGQLIQELAVELGKLDLGIRIFTGQPGYAFQKESAPGIEDCDGVIIQRSRTTRIWSKRIRGKAINGILFCLRAGLHLIKNSRDIDLLLLTTAPPFLPILGYLANKIFHLPYICLIYDLYPDVAVELNVIPHYHWVVRLWDRINRRIWQRAQQVIVLSPSMKDRVVAKCPHVKHKITVIHNWADPNWIVPIPKEDNWFAQTFNLVDHFTVLYSGNMGRCHDTDTILEAAKILRNEPIKFVFIGNGAKRKEFQSQVARLGLKNCQFLPYQEKQNLPYSLTACDLSLVSISRSMEGLVAPSKFYTALAAGKPVAAICEPHSYLREIITDASCGEVFNNGDAVGLANFIRRLSVDSKLAQRMGNAARVYLKSHFTLDLIAKQYGMVLDMSAAKDMDVKYPSVNRQPSAKSF
ncbi:MAG TPA: glycosyltransferase WbuB [Cyanobacteria bacterium UBA11149]|nr:glycosyltransferase WbuB [Cyanobacteria bacterium UBA11367]HBE60160.1 glycosyltransferase WbuB [Cyanobacteria bacterium UBA11366]HBK64870.1 glycosyltransferase WbuB [Cyanobacteria bacterium UBA11166]HBR75479.1 glycosyltransferase WbuB [Cyanobacteria bacterium UBA11159]HBS70577.1 glycosyltransferase WbuB [Cyanobacteria bacterium UBA11153]HBW88769.1 glycosyltransferase WbuB [Cyanobacteria bacterium UBA11149]HCA98217.1 glycosyltransferase WbuB [Cyanobacteria bacterium UBA9226]